MTYFTLVYNMCTQKPPHNYSEQLYQRYKKAISDYLSSSVLPAVHEKTGQYMLKEVGKRWSHHKINVKWMKNFFSYLVSPIVPLLLFVATSFRPLYLTCVPAGPLPHQATESAVHAGSRCAICLFTRICSACSAVVSRSHRHAMFQGRDTRRRYRGRALGHPCSDSAGARRRGCGPHSTERCGGGNRRATCPVFHLLILRLAAVGLQIFVEMGMGDLEVFQTDFEAQASHNLQPSLRCLW